MSETWMEVRSHLAEMRHERGECGPGCSYGECENCHWNPVERDGLCAKCLALPYYRLGPERKRAMLDGILSQLGDATACILCGGPIGVGSTMRPRNTCRSCWSEATRDE